MWHVRRLAKSDRISSTSEADRINSTDIILLLYDFLAGLRPDMEATQQVKEAIAAALASLDPLAIEKCSKELGIPAEKVPPFQEVLRGKINFIGMVRGKENEIYRKYLNWYRSLLKR